MAQLKDLIVAGSARLLGKAYFEDTVTINDTLEVDAIKADSIITPSLNSDGTNLVVGGNISLTAGGKYIEVGNGAAATNAANTGVLRVKGGLSASHHSYFDNTVTIKGGLTAQSTLAVTGAITGSSTLTVSGVAKTGNTLTIYNSSGGNTTLHFDRGTSAGWQIQDSSAILYFKCDWDPATNKKNADGSFTNRMQIDTLGNVIATGRVTSKGLTSSDTVVPSTNQGTTLGTSSLYWKKLYVGDGTAGAVSNTGAQSGSIIVNGGMSLTHDIAIKSEDNDKAIKFVYGKSSNNGYGWQIKYSGTGADDANYLSIESSGSDGTYKTAVRYGLLTLDAGFGGHVYPITAFGKNIGSTSNPWATVYAKSHKIYNASKKDAGGIYVQTDGTTSEQGESYVVVGNSTASGTAGNSRGSIFLYSTSTGYTRLTPGTNNGTNYNLYLPGATGQLVYHTNDTAIGGSLTPVYVDSDGKVTACTVSGSGNRWGVLTSVGSDGVMEAGKYIDFHNTDSNTTDYSYRITTDTSLLTGSGGIKATTTMESGTTMTVGTNLTVKSNAYFANGTTYKIDSSGHAVFNNTTANGNLTVNGNTALGNATTDTTTIKGAVSITYDGTAASGSAATALSNMKGAIKVLDGGIVTNKDVAAKSFYVHDKARMQYDTTNNYVYFTFN